LQLTHCGKDKDNIMEGNARRVEMSQELPAYVKAILVPWLTLRQKKNILAADSSVFINLTGARINRFNPTKCVKLQLAREHVQQSRQLVLGEKLAATKIMNSVE